MISRWEDFSGKILMIVIFAFMTVAQVYSILNLLHGVAAIDWLMVISRFFGLSFLLLIVIFTICRLPPKRSASGIEPRLTAIVGTFMLSTLVVLPAGSVDPGFKFLSTSMIVSGSVLSAYCIAWLGRSFSIMASARRLVVAGPYRFVRHPLYAAEALTAIGMVVANWSVAATAIGVIWFAFQWRRMVHEENVLRAVFPEYRDYVANVPMLLPGSLLFFAASRCGDI